MVTHHSLLLYILNPFTTIFAISQSTQFYVLISFVLPILPLPVVVTLRAAAVPTVPSVWDSCLLKGMKPEKNGRQNVLTICFGLSCSLKFTSSLTACWELVLLCLISTVNAVVFYDDGKSLSRDNACILAMAKIPVYTALVSLQLA